MAANFQFGIQTRWTLAVALGSALLSGCVPVPSFHYFAPAVSGTVLRQGLPVAGAQVVVSSRHGQERQIGFTDDEGHFALQPLREFQLTTPVMGDPTYAFRVEIAVGGQDYRGYSEGRVGDAPSALKIECDLARPRPLVLADGEYHCSKTR